MNRKRAASLAVIAVMVVASVCGVAQLTMAADWVTLTYDDFESGFGSYTDGGGDCSRYTGGTHAHQGSAAIDIQDNSGVSSSFYHTGGIDVHNPGYTQIKVEFWFKAVSMESGEDFWVQYYDGSSWQTVASYAQGTDFSNDQFYFETVTIDEGSYTFPTDMRIRFMCDASTNYDDVYVDEVAVSAIGGSPSPTDTPVPPTDTPVPGGDNKLTNPGLESGNTGWTQVSGSWDINQPGAGNTHDGSWAFTMSTGTASGTGPWQSVSGVPTNTDYVASFWMKGSGNVRMTIDDSGWNLIGGAQCDATGTWTQCSYQFNTGSNTSLIVQMQDHTAGTAYVDDLYLGPAGGAPTNTPAPPTNTPVSPTDTPVPPTNTPAGGCGTTNVALNQPTTTSSVEGSGLEGSNAVDGSGSTRWSSQYSDPQWIYVDLGSTYEVCRVVLDWETAYGDAYQIQVSGNASNWTTIYSTSSGNGGTDDLTGLSGSGRYVRMYGTSRGTEWGYSLYEFEVYVSGAGPTATPVPPTNTPVPPTNTPVPGGDNELTNPGLESGNTGWSNVGGSWSINQPGSGNTYSGSWAFTMSTGTASFTGPFQTVNSVPTNTDYVASFWMKGSGNVRMTIDDSGWNLIGGAQCDATGTWTQCSYQFNTGSNTTLIVQMQDHAAGTAYVDDLYLGPVGGGGPTATPGAPTATPGPDATPSTSGYTLVDNWDFGTSGNVYNHSVLDQDFNPYGIAGTVVINNEWQRYQPFNSTNHYFTSNTLDLRADDNLGGCYDGGISSGQITTDKTYYPSNGKTLMFQLRAQVPTYLHNFGSWPAFWMYAKSSPNTSSEIDIFEVWNKLSQNSYDWTGYDHGDGNGSYYYTPPYGWDSQWSIWSPGYDFGADYHVYTLIWEEGDIQKWVDGTMVTGKYFDWIFGSNPQVLVNLAVGGNSFDGNNPCSQPSPNDTTFPIVFSLDWLKVYEK